MITLSNHAIVSCGQRNLDAERVVQIVNSHSLPDFTKEVLVVVGQRQDLFIVAFVDTFERKIKTVSYQRRSQVERKGQYAPVFGIGRNRSVKCP